MKSSTLAFAILVAISPTTMADDSPTWQGILGDLVKTEKAGYGGLCGIVLDPAGGTVLTSATAGSTAQTIKPGRFAVAANNNPREGPSPPVA